MPELSLQAQHGPNGFCFGCGPKNEKGLRIQSFVEGDEVVAIFTPEKHHQAFEGVVNGGVVGALFDCHGNWTAAYHLFQAAEGGEFPSTVTVEMHTKLLRPTPSKGSLKLRARAVEVKRNRARIAATLEAAGEICAEYEGTYVAVKPGHPAYHRWQ